LIGTWSLSGLRASANWRRKCVDSGRSSTWEVKDGEGPIQVEASSVARRSVSRSCIRVVVLGHGDE
jgi:hypothetical protein